MNRTRAFRRDVRNRKIAHRKRICKRAYGWDWYKHDGQYSKGKIHCSCKMCTYSKTFDLPHLYELRDREYVKEAIKDYNNG